MQCSNYDQISRKRNQAKQGTWCEITVCSGLVLNIISGDELADVVLKRYGAINYDWGIKSASTDFVILCA
jgi:hypothetical protein